MNVGNPLDVGPSGLFRQAMEVALSEPGIDGVVAFPIIPWAVISPLLETQSDAVAGMFVPEEVTKSQTLDRPVVISALGHPTWKEWIARFFGPQISIVSTPQIAAKAMAELFRHRKWCERQGLPESSD